MLHLRFPESKLCARCVLYASSGWLLAVVGSTTVGVVGGTLVGAHHDVLSDVRQSASQPAFEPSCGAPGCWRSAHALKDLQ
eukprot:3726882-Pleurochrysis_carterae.AAC.1